MNAFTRGALKCVCICWIAIAFGPAFAEDQPTAPNAAPSLASFLSANGTFELPLGFVGNIDPSGWSMAKSKDGPLRFVPGAGFSNQNKLFGVPGGCNGYVFSILVAPSGLIYLGGDFVICEEVLASHVAAYDPRTRRFFSLGTGAQNGVSGSSFASVYAMGLAGSDLYVAGDFNEAGGESANYVARWNGTHWSALGSGESNGVFGLVYDLAVSGNDVYVGGSFSNAGEVQVNGIARWNGSTWSALGTGVGGIVDARVYAIEISGSDLYIGGEFKQAGGVAANYIARWNGSAWSAFGSGSANGTNAAVNSFGRAGANLYVGGNFNQAGGQPANGIARWDGSAWQSIGSGAENGVDGQVVAIKVSGNNLYIGGNFYTAGTVPAHGIAMWNGSVWSSLGVGAANGTNNTVWAIAQSGNDLFVGGYFDQAGELSANFVASWNGSAWSALGAGVGNGVNHTIQALAVTGNNLYAGGFFSQAGGQPANRIARWNGSKWSPLGTGDANGVNGVVFALSVFGNDLYAGGWFRQAGGQPANLIARWNGNAWSTLGAGLGGGDYPSVLAMKAVGSDLYVGGEFIEAGGQTANKIARWNGTTWSSLGTGTANGVSRGDFVGVQSLAVMGTDLYVGGNFLEAGGQPAIGVARWSGSAWSSLGTGTANGLNGPAPALAVVGTDLYAGGSFSAAGGQPAYGIARWNGTSWSPLGTEAVNGVNGSVLALAVAGNDLYVAGSFSRAGGLVANSLARWDGTAWHGLNIDAPPQVIRALIAEGGSLYAGGAGLTQTPLPDLQSKAITGAIADAGSGRIVVSRNGTALGFSSDATNLVAGDANGRSDIFLRDRILGATTKVSAVADAINGGAAESYSDPSISADGRRVAFSGSSGQIYAAVDGAGRVLSSSATGTLGNAASGRVFLAGSGSFAFFDSQASNLLPSADGNGAVADVFLKDVNTGSLALISRSPTGTAANGASHGPWAADDGQTIVFDTFATNIVAASAADAGQNKGSVSQAMMMRGGGFGQSRLYLSRNLATGQLGNGNSTQVKVTPDGRFGVFESLAGNLIAGDSNNVSDIYRFEITGNTMTKLQRVSVSRYDFQGNGASKNASISDDGQFVTFETEASNLVELDRNTTTDIMVKWMETGEILRLSRTTDEQQPNGPSVQPSISGDGSSIVFASGASNLTPGDNNNAQDVFAVPLRGAGPVNPSGAWYDPAQDGHGLQLQLLPGNRLLAFWYTFDPAGNRAYFIGDGVFDGSAATLTNLRPVGSFFPPNFNSSQVSLQAFGTMRLTFDSCSQGTVNFTLPQAFGQGSMRLTRLTQPAGLLCGTTPTTTATGPMAGATGAWFNPQQDGQGFVVESLAGGLLLANWYTQAPSPGGGQSWITGVGTISGNQATMQMLLVEGGRFIPNFNPAAVLRPTLGTMTMTLNSCSAGQVSWSFGSGYGSGSMPLQRLTTPAGVVCSSP